jgi:hypothetical protein
MWGIKFSAITGISQINNTVPAGYYLEQNFPNPFNPSTTVGFGIPVNEHVKVTVYDLTGRMISEPVNDFFNAGNYKFTWSAVNISSGIYFIKFVSGGKIITRKMMLIK